MILIKKKQEPLALVKAKREGLTEYSQLNGPFLPAKDAVRKQLLEEQGFLCAYCMRRIYQDTMQIEHYIAQNPQDGDYDAALTIEYINMLGVCCGNKGRTKKQLTCDQHRENIPLTVNPLDARTMSKIRYGSDGTIDSEDPDIKRDVDKVLNLNCPESLLRENRKAALDRLKRKLQTEYRNKTCTAEQLQRTIDGLRTGEAGQRLEYVGILLWYLEKRKARA